MATSSSSTTSYPVVEYAIFDMDGLLIQRQAAEYILAAYPDVKEHMTADEYLDERNEMQQALFKKVPPMAGAVHLVQSLHAQGVPLALATGSTYENFLYKTGHLPHIFSLFPADCIVTADSPSVKPGRGKPHPDIFLAAAATLGRDVGTAEACTDAQREERKRAIVFEDAVPGVKSGVAAGMNVIWIPDPNLRALAPDEDYGAAQVLMSLEDWDPVQWGLKAFPSPSAASYSSRSQ
ncbi:HAD-like domain-containing protein [Dioszegia hungarica]|uniref:HAD-like domain-containing protein n=1 Tax=Dioszegia hungarica TaxID=4972 RepID=A0AA38LYA3_9TREE|nr:HAD-like domain-containing protein [Dioszegia hungarica]KAI9639778.1 HAD-like domain-containing protein [Dioszegia hungarica]